MKVEVVTENEDGSTLERWTGEGAYEAALALVEPDWLVLAVPAGSPPKTSSLAHAERNNGSRR